MPAKATAILEKPAPVKTAEKKTEKKAEKKLESVTFVWNAAVGARTMTIDPATTKFTEMGPVTDRQAFRIVVKNGLYTTSDPEKIEALKECNNFNKQTIDGFQVLRKISPEEQVRAILKSSGLKPEDVLNAMQSEE